MAYIEKRGESSFLLRVEAGYDSKRKRIRRSKTIRLEDKSLLKTKRKLTDFLEVEYHKFKAEVQSGNYIFPEKMTLTNFINDWKTKYAEKEIAETSISNHFFHIN